MARGWFIRKSLLGQGHRFDRSRSIESLASYVPASRNRLSKLRASPCSRHFRLTENGLHIWTLPAEFTKYTFGRFRGPARPAHKGCRSPTLEEPCQCGLLTDTNFSIGRKTRGSWLSVTR